MCLAHLPVVERTVPILLRVVDASAHAEELAANAGSRDPDAGLRPAMRGNANDYPGLLETQVPAHFLLYDCIRPRDESQERDERCEDDDLPAIHLASY